MVNEMRIRPPNRDIGDAGRGRRARVSLNARPPHAAATTTSRWGRGRMNRLAKILLMCALAAGAATTAAAEDVLKLAVPQRGAWDAGIPELGQRGGIFARHGLKLEILYTSAGPESIQALIAGGVDVATASGVSAAFGTFAKGAPIRIIGSEIVGAPDLFWYVPGASPIKTIQDFNGKSIAFSLVGSSSHAGVLALIAQYHLTAKPTSTGSISATITQTMTG